jgi:hypothetical protein
VRLIESLVEISRIIEISKKKTTKISEKRNKLQIKADRPKTIRPLTNFFRFGTDSKSSSSEVPDW